jgi:hypothetical protein
VKLGKIQPVVHLGGLMIVRQWHSSSEGHMFASSHRRGAGKKMRAYATLLQVVLSCALLPLAGHAEGIDTEHLFGFVIGSDVGEAGEREFQNQTTGRFAKSTGTYRALTDATELEFVPAKNFAWSSLQSPHRMTSAGSQDLMISSKRDCRASPWTCGTDF